MRLIGTLAEEGKYDPLAFAHFLKTRGIDARIEVIDPSESAAASYRIWVIEEDQVEETLRLYNEYKENPQNSLYKQGLGSYLKKPAPTYNRSRVSKRTFAPLSTLIIAMTIMLFMWARFQGHPGTPPTLKGVIEGPLLSPIERTLLFDYPEYFEIRDTLFTEWPLQEIKKKQPPSTTALAILQKLHKREVWMGIYNRILLHKENASIPLQYTGPLFEKISEGQFWRLLTPAFLHFDILHIFFNLLWFVILSNQIELRIGSFRTLLFILLTGVASNTAQYLISGPFFMGLSGIVCAMAGFIWARQQKAPWEGYLVQRLTLIFLGIFILGMFALSTTFFLLEFFKGTSITMPIANTAHLAGALLGYLLGRTSLFASH